eukprot:555201-Pyramimonas_sp.AAC.1
MLRSALRTHGVSAESPVTSTQLRRYRKAEGSKGADSSACKPSPIRIAALPEVAWGPCLSDSSALGREAASPRPRAWAAAMGKRPGGSLVSCSATTSGQ